jgi:hypothetical protein
MPVSVSVEKSDIRNIYNSETILWDAAMSLRDERLKFLSLQPRGAGFPLRYNKQQGIIKLKPEPRRRNLHDL